VPQNSGTNYTGGRGTINFSSGPTTGTVNVSPMGQSGWSFRVQEYRTAKVPVWKFWIKKQW
jgi:hypothetical protein